METKEIINLFTDEFIYSLPKHDMEDLTKRIHLAYQKKYRDKLHSKIPFAGYKAMSTDDLNKFFQAFKPHEIKLKMLFFTQSGLGLRIGEAIIIKLSDIDFEKRIIKIHTEKSRGQCHFIPIHDLLLENLKEYCKAYSDDINRSGGYLFFVSEKAHCKNHFHISSHTARKMFREICSRADLVESYSITEARQPGFEGKNSGHVQYRFTPHSLRHAMGKLLANSGVPIEIAQKILRHNEISSTGIYYNQDFSLIQNTMQALFSNNRREQIRQNVESFSKIADEVKQETKKD